LEAPENFYHLQRKIELSLIPLGISEEKRAFSPHLTLARIPVQHDCKLVNQVYERLLAYNREEFGNMTVNQVTLFQSTLTRDGPIYHSLAEIPLPESI
jgi:2'-5' RNA ligase